MKIGICGVSGFIGKSLLSSLKKDDIHEIITFSRTVSKYESGKKIKNFVGKIEYQNIEFKSFLDSIDILIYLVDSFQEDMNFLFGKQLIVHKIAVDMIGKSKVKKVIYFSSIAVYGEGEKKKETDILFPCTNYGTMKMLSERLFQTLELLGKELIILRPSSIYGELSKKGVLYHFIHNIKTEKKVTIYGNGEQKREFLYIDDFIEAILLCLEYKKNAIFNVSSPNTISLNEVLIILREKFKFDFSVQYNALDINNPIQVLSEDISLIQKELNWTPQIDIVTGLGKILGKKFM